MERELNDVEDDFIQEGIDISLALVDVDERLISNEFEPLEELTKRMREFADHLDVHINQQRKKSGNPLPIKDRRNG